MNDIAIKVENLTKEYKIVHEVKEPYKKFSDTIISFFKKILTPWKFFNKNEVEDFKALNNINFEIKKGDKVGIIGRNGAGKSTLLKILSRITEPTEGTVRINGRVVSLLEVGTGFHPELTGRENIYLNGSILGMTRKEIDEKFDEIVEFSGCKKFLDTPIKRYSSGMKVRLGFAVAAHLESEILIVDEVLAVGDGKFQKKCIEKMKAIGDEGRTVLFVSHNMALIQSFCDKGIFLNTGRIAIDGKIEKIINEYMNFNDCSYLGSVSLENHLNRIRGMKNIMKQVSMMSNEIIKDVFRQDEPITIKIDYFTLDRIKIDRSGFLLYSQNGILVSSFNTHMAFKSPYDFPQSGYTTFTIKPGQLAPGNYKITVSIGAESGEIVDKVEHAISFDVEPADIYGTGRLITRLDGIIALKVATKMLVTN